MAEPTEDPPVTIEPVPSSPNTSPGATASSTDPLNPMMDQSLQLFHDLAVQFLDALAEVWPECTMVKEAKLEYRMACVQGLGNSTKAAQARVVQAYHSAMSPFYARCSQKDETVFVEQDLCAACTFLAKIGFNEKWTDDLHPETKENVWAYMHGLNQYANMYNLYSKVPSQMLSTIEGMATGIANQIEKGDLNMQDINVQTLGQQVASNIDMNELNEFAASMMQDQGSMTQMYAMLGSMMSQISHTQAGSE